MIKLYESIAQGIKDLGPSRRDPFFNYTHKFDKAGELTGLLKDLTTTGTGDLYRADDRIIPGLDPWALFYNTLTITESSSNTVGTHAFNDAALLGRERERSEKASEEAPETTDRVVILYPITAWLKTRREILEDMPRLQTAIIESLLKALRARICVSVLRGDNSSPPGWNSIATISTTQTITTRSAPNIYLDLRSKILTAAEGGIPISTMLMQAKTIDKVLIARDNKAGEDPGVDTSPYGSVLSVPIIPMSENRLGSDNRIIMGPFTDRAEVILRNEIRIATSTEQYFTDNEIAILITAEGNFAPANHTGGEFFRINNANNYKNN